MRTARTAGKFFESKFDLECAGEPGKLVKPRCRHFTNLERAGVEGQGFLKAWGWGAPCQEETQGVMLPAEGRDESGPEVFSSHGFSSQVRILAPEGKAWSRP